MRVLRTAAVCVALFASVSAHVRDGDEVERLRASARTALAAGRTD